ncbi:MAG: CFI-box-CTERM domain-containing protein, partial [Syntrophomonas sp.]
TNLASGSYEVTARAEGWQRQPYAGNVNVTASNETANINYTLQRGSATVAAVSDIPDFHINSGTPVNDLGLPSNIKITLSDDSRPHVGLSWDGGTPSYSPTVDGIYVFSGNLLIPSTNNPANQKAKLDVITGNAAPTFTSAIISGLAKEGNQLTASGIGYADAESDAAGTTLYQWIICETAAGEYVNIPEATSSSYTVKVSDIGKYIKVLVTPVASTGTLVGKGVLSSAIGPVCPVGFTNLSVAIDPTSKQVTISGNIDSGGDREVSVNVTDPDGNVDFTGKTKSDSSGAFNFIYTTTSTATGNFSVELNGDGVSTPAIIKFSSSGAFIDECFIATASFGSKFEPAVVLLRQFRDKYLLSNRPGQAFVNFYYKNSPPIAAYIAGNEVLKAIVRAILTPIVGIVYLVFHPMLAYALIILIVLRLIARRKRNINTRRVAY